MTVTHYDALWVQQNIMVQWVHDDPTFAYTIGLSHHGLPELIVVGMPYQQSGVTLNLIAAWMYRNGAFKPGDIDIDIFTAPTKFGSVSPAEMEKRMTAFGPKRHGNALQVLWPDRRGIFPDEPGYMHSPQPILA